MKQALALIGAVLVLAYVLAQALLALLQPLFLALAGKLHYSTNRKATNLNLNQEAQLQKEDKVILGFAFVALGYFAAHAMGALMKLWIAIAANALR